MVVRMMCADVVVNCVLLVLVIIAREAENTLNGLKNTKKNWKKLKKCLTILLPCDIIDLRKGGNKNGNCCNCRRESWKYWCRGEL